MTDPGPIHILLVEDDQKGAYALRKGLSEAGYNIALADSVQAAEQLISMNAFDLILLDLGLPDRDGLEFLRDLRNRHVAIPVIVLTARDDVGDRVIGLDTGADDYLPKPFSFNELLARIRAQVRRAREAGETVIRVGDLELNLITRRTSRAGKALDLTPKEFDLLAYLAREAGMPVSRDRLARDVWQVRQRNSSLDNVIDVHITRLREKVDRDYAIRLLHTVRGVGYKLEAAS